MKNFKTLYPNLVFAMQEINKNSDIGENSNIKEFFKDQHLFSPEEFVKAEKFLSAYTRVQISDFATEGPEADSDMPVSDPDEIAGSILDEFFAY